MTKQLLFCFKTKSFSKIYQLTFLINISFILLFHCLQKIVAPVENYWRVILLNNLTLRLILSTSPALSPNPHLSSVLIYDLHPLLTDVHFMFHGEMASFVFKQNLSAKSANQYSHYCQFHFIIARAQFSQQMVDLAED